MKKRPIFGLICAGGGAHGAYQVGVLKFIHQKFCIGDQSPFQVFTGCSCGSLNTSFYAAESYNARQSRLWLEDLWMGFHIPSYHGNMLKNFLLFTLREARKPPHQRSKSWAILDPAPMINVIEKGFLRNHLDKAMTEGTTLGIGVVTTEIVSGRCCWFTEGPNARSWNLFHSIGKIDRIGTPHVAASCSVPFFLPPVKVGERYFLDGSVSQERPLSAAIAMGATKLLCISTDKPYPDDLPTYSPKFEPRLSNVIRMMLNQWSDDNVADEAIQLQAFNQYYEALARSQRKRPEEEDMHPLFHEEHLPSHYRPIEVFQIHPSRRIRQTSVDADYGHGEHVKRRSTRFMFHKKFIRELIDLGYRDAAAQQDKLKEFFTTKEAPRRWFPWGRRSGDKS